MVLGDLLLLSGNDIPFPGARVNIHQPTLKEIAYIGEEAFFTGCELLKFSKDILTNEDKISLSDYSDFHILMSIMCDKSAATQFNAASALLVLEMLFPNYEVSFDMNNGIIFFLSRETKELCGSLNPTNFDAFKNILKVMFCLEKTSSSTEYDP